MTARQKGRLLAVDSSGSPSTGRTTEPGAEELAEIVPFLADMQSTLAFHDDVEAAGNRIGACTSI
ncbi:hypothetical protein [Nonomuraea zeae]|uniref:Uncharacterized protein n=1 Tax=Nonomuraea zeae TaxID=1642303 RepID=A0A5S4G6M0_9ACTN|nr:hypothetical protein [Nonomuraea zeae]TMR28051.1 hypothetical protein ETD85_37170 [Nonomuraea zeae]